MPATHRIFEGQLAHLGWLAVLLAGLFAASRLEDFSDGAFLGVRSDGWVIVSAAGAVAHQLFVWFCWRTQMHAGLLTRMLGRHAFIVYAAVFTVLLLARPVLITALAVANTGTLPVNPRVATGLGIVLAVPGVYLGYSIVRYFGYRRACGIDHFDAGYRSAPLVREGIFRFTPNAMYLFGFLLLWLPGLFGRSVAALAVALFSHLYIWVHYACTEKPDMRFIYGASAGPGPRLSSGSSTRRST
jgi:protein-S-isoprenylcysteine O-methyltransferase Ste14